MASRISKISVYFKAFGAKQVADQTDNITRSSTRLGQVSASTGRQFSSQAKGLGGLVAVYAGAAANIFAIQQAFSALNKAAQFENVIEGTKRLAENVGTSGEKLINTLKRITLNQLSTAQAAEKANLALSAGLNTKQIEQLTSISLKASRALGRDLGEAYERLIRGTAKLEPELLDELGIFTRIDPAVQTYARSVNKAVSQLTNFERRQAFANAVILEGERKFSIIDTSAESTQRSLATLIAKLSDLALVVGQLLAGPLGGLADFFTSNMGNAITALGLLALQVFGKLRTSLAGAFDSLGTKITARFDNVINNLNATGASFDSLTKKAKTLKDAFTNTGTFAGGRAGSAFGKEIKQYLDDIAKGKKVPNLREIVGLNNQLTTQIGETQNKIKSLEGSQDVLKNIYGPISPKTVEQIEKNNEALVKLNKQLTGQTAIQKEFAASTVNSSKSAVFLASGIDKVKNSFITFSKVISGAFRLLNTLAIAFGSLQFVGALFGIDVLGTISGWIGNIGAESRKNTKSVEAFSRSLLNLGTIKFTGSSVAQIEKLNEALELVELRSSSMGLRGATFSDPEVNAAADLIQQVENQAIVLGKLADAGDRSIDIYFSMARAGAIAFDDLGNAYLKIQGVSTQFFLANKKGADATGEALAFAANRAAFFADNYAKGLLNAEEAAKQVFAVQTAIKGFDNIFDTANPFASLFLEGINALKEQLKLLQQQSDILTKIEAQTKAIQEIYSSQISLSSDPLKTLLSGVISLDKGTLAVANNESEQRKNAAKELAALSKIDSSRLKDYKEFTKLGELLNDQLEKRADIENRLTNAGDDKQLLAQKQNVDLSITALNTARDALGLDSAAVASAERRQKAELAAIGSYIQIQQEVAQINKENEKTRLQLKAQLDILKLQNDVLRIQNAIAAERTRIQIEKDLAQAGREQLEAARNLQKVIIESQISQLENEKTLLNITKDRLNLERELVKSRLQLNTTTLTNTLDDNIGGGELLQKIANVYGEGITNQDKLINLQLRIDTLKFNKAIAVLEQERANIELDFQNKQLDFANQRDLLAKDENILGIKMAAERETLAAELDNIEYEFKQRKNDRDNQEKLLGLEAGLAAAQAEVQKRQAKSAMDLYLFEQKLTWEKYDAIELEAQTIKLFSESILEFIVALERSNLLESGMDPNSIQNELNQLRNNYTTGVLNLFGEIDKRVDLLKRNSIEISSTQSKIYQENLDAADLQAGAAGNALAQYQAFNTKITDIETKTLSDRLSAAKQISKTNMDRLATELQTLQVTKESIEAQEKLSEVDRQIAIANIDAKRLELEKAQQVAEYIAGLEKDTLFNVVKAFADSLKDNLTSTTEGLLKELNSGTLTGQSAGVALKEFASNIILDVQKAALQPLIDKFTSGIGEVLSTSFGFDLPMSELTTNTVSITESTKKTTDLISSNQNLTTATNNLTVAMNGKTTGAVNYGSGTTGVGSLSNAAPIGTPGSENPFDLANTGLENVGKTSEQSFLNLDKASISIEQIGTTAVTTFAAVLAATGSFGDSLKATLVSTFLTIFAQLATSTGGFGLFAAGGTIRKMASGGSNNLRDRVPVMLEPGEFVVRRDAARKAGVTNMAKLNSGTLNNPILAQMLMQDGFTVPKTTYGSQENATGNMFFGHRGGNDRSKPEAGKSPFSIGFTDPNIATAISLIGLGIPMPFSLVATAISGGIKVGNYNSIETARSLLGMPALSTEQSIGALMGLNSYSDGFVGDATIGPRSYGVSLGYAGNAQVEGGGLVDGRTTLTVNEAVTRQAMALGRAASTVSVSGGKQASSLGGVSTGGFGGNTGLSGPGTMGTGGNIGGGISGFSGISTSGYSGGTTSPGFGGKTGTSGGGSAGGAGGGRSGGGGMGCFVKGTPILMADGTTKPIEEVQINDIVISFHETGELTTGRVVNTMIFVNKEVIELNNEVIVTPDHPFVNGMGLFEAIGYNPREVKKVDGTNVSVQINDIIPLHTVYNFEVENTHTYIAAGYRVHNIKAAGGWVRRMAAGGMVRDSVPSLLSSGDFVVKRPMVKHMAAGGSVGGSVGGTGSSAPSPVNVNVINQGTPQSVVGAPKIALNGDKMVIDIIMRDMAGNGRLRKAMRR